VLHRAGKPGGTGLITGLGNVAIGVKLVVHEVAGIMEGGEREIVGK